MTIIRRHNDVIFIWINSKYTYLFDYIEALAKYPYFIAALNFLLSINYKSGLFKDEPFQTFVYELEMRLQS